MDLLWWFRQQHAIQDLLQKGVIWSRSSISPRTSLSLLDPFSTFSPEWFKITFSRKLATALSTPAMRPWGPGSQLGHQWRPPSSPGYEPRWCNFYRWSFGVDPGYTGCSVSCLSEPWQSWFYQHPLAQLPIPVLTFCLQVWKALLLGLILHLHLSLSLFLNC